MLRKQKKDHPSFPPACQSAAAGRHVLGGNPFVDARLKFRLLNPATNGILKAGHSGMTTLMFWAFF